jgi:CrcB protein
MNPMNILTLPSILLVAAGGGIGCTLRFLIVKLVIRLNPSAFPLGTMAVNILGSFLIGAMLAKYGMQHSARVFFVTGICGGFTTFSAFSWDALQLLHRGQYGLAVLYIAGSVALCIAATAVGFALARQCC